VPHGLIKEYQGAMPTDMDFKLVEPDQAPFFGRVVQRSLTFFPWFGLSSQQTFGLQSILGPPTAFWSHLSDLRRAGHL